MTLAELNKKIAGINASVQRVNNERQVNMGKYEALKSQLDDALIKYNDTYGVSLNPGNLSEEVERVSKELTSQVEKMEAALEKINQKDYAGAEAILGVAPEETPKSEAPTFVPVAEQAPPVQDTIPLEETVPAEEPIQTPPVFQKPPIAEKSVEQPASASTPAPEPEVPQMPPTFEKPVEEESEDIAPPKQVGQIKQGGLTGAAKFGAPPAEDDDDMDIPAPPPAAPPARPKRTMTFSSIMSGSSFNPGGN